MYHAATYTTFLCTSCKLLHEKLCILDQAKHNFGVLRLTDDNN